MQYSLYEQSVLKHPLDPTFLDVVYCYDIITASLNQSSVAEIIEFIKISILFLELHFLLQCLFLPLSVDYMLVGVSATFCRIAFHVFVKPLIRICYCLSGLHNVLASCMMHIAMRNNLQ